MLALLLAVAASSTVTFGPARPLLEACAGAPSFLGVASGTLEDGSPFELSSVSLDVARVGAGAEELTVAARGTLAGEPFEELSFTGRFDDEGAASGPLAPVHAALTTSHALSTWLGGRTVRAGERLPLPAHVLRSLGGASRGHVVVEPAKGGARLRLDLSGTRDRRVRRVQAELLVDPATWWTKSARVDVEGAIRGHARGFGVCKAG